MAGARRPERKCLVRERPIVGGQLLALPDHLEVYAAHFGGAACGKGLSGKAASTIGFERRFNPALQIGARNEFERFVLADLPPQPATFAENRRRNLGLD